MSRIELDRTTLATTLQRLASRLTSLLRNAARPLIDAQRRATERRELEMLDDDTLYDIGVTRGELNAYLAGHGGRAQPSPTQVERTLGARCAGCAP